MQWKDLSTHKVVNLVEYVRQYMVEKPGTKIYIGTDSQNRRDKTDFAIVVVLHYLNRGAKVLYVKTTEPKIRDRFTRLLKEVQYSLEIAAVLREGGLDMPLTIDIDLNPDPLYKSNDVLTSALGWVVGMGFECRNKPYALAASYAADRLVKH